MAFDRPSPTVSPRHALAALAALATLAVASGCSSVGGSAVRTGPVALGQYTGAVAVYSAQPPPPDAVDLGVVEVHGSQQEAAVGQLLPELVRRAAMIGGNIVVVEGIRARFDMIARNQTETFYYKCGLNYTCAGTRVYTINDEVMTVTMFGRALTTSARAPGAPGPLTPARPPLLGPEEPALPPAGPIHPTAPAPTSDPAPDSDPVQPARPAPPSGAP